MNINKIKLSGTTYSIQDENATKTVELTQAQYDALSVKDPNTFYIITDATAGDLSNYYTKSETSGATQISTALASKADTATTYTKTEVDNAITAATSTKQDQLVSGSNIKTINNESILGSGNITIEGGGSSYTAGDGIDITNDVISVTGKVDTTAFTAHTADTVIHVTSAEKTAWNAKSDFSGDYNDLTNKPTIPTVPTSNTAFTNDAGYITIDAISGKVDTSTYNTYTAATDTAIAGKQDTLVSGTNIKTINNESILGSGNITIEGGGGGKAVSAGTNISITTGETTDTINCTLPITISDSDNGSKQSIAIGDGSSAHISNWYDSIAIGKNSKGYFGSVVIGSNPTAYTPSNGVNVAIGNSTKFYDQSVIIGSNAEGYNGYRANSVALGYYARATNMKNAVAIGAEVYTTGTTKTNINNQLKIDDSNQVYIYNKDNTEMICLQDALGGGVTVDPSLDSGSTNPVANSAITTAINNTPKLSNLSTGYVSGMEYLLNRVYLKYRRFDINNTYYDSTAIWFGMINGQYVCKTSSPNNVTPSGLMNLSLVETSAITTSITSASTDSQVPSAKAVYDMVGNINTILESI